MSQQKLPRLSCIAVALAACLAAPSAFSKPTDGSSHAASVPGAAGVSGKNQQDQNPNDSASKTTPTPPAKAKQLQQVVVTGTLLPIDPEAAAVPVTTLDADELSRTGVTSNMLDTLRKAVPA
ncbi:MAG: hypothetical protein ABI767_10495, partial [Rhodanobacter sp.]